MPSRATTLTTTSRNIVEYNPARSSLLVQNNGTDRVFLSENPVSVLTDGLILDVGDTYEKNYRNGEEPELSMFAVANSGSQNIRITEQFGERIK